LASGDTEESRVYAVETLPETNVTGHQRDRHPQPELRRGVV